MQNSDYTKMTACSGNLPYLLWVGFYFLLFWLALGGGSLNFIILFLGYVALIAFAFTSLAEALWRTICGVRPLRTRAEKTRLKALLAEVYAEAQELDQDIPKSIKLYIHEDMDINAYAFGQGTLVLTKGSIALLSDDCLKGLIAHELGHFAHYDTRVQLIASVGNLLPSLLFKMLDYMARLYAPMKVIVKPLFFFNDCFLMHGSRHQEYMADEFALRCGFGGELTLALSEINEVMIEKPGV